MNISKLYWDDGGGVGGVGVGGNGVGAGVGGHSGL